MADSSVANHFSRHPAGRNDTKHTSSSLASISALGLEVVTRQKNEINNSKNRIKNKTITYPRLHFLFHLHGTQ
jgi:hypothetical protein